MIYILYSSKEPPFAFATLAYIHVIKILSCTLSLGQSEEIETFQED